MHGTFHLGGEWLVQPALCRLSRQDRTLAVRAKVMDLLVYLAEHAGEVVTKDRLLQDVWGGEAVSESALTRTITELRQALDEDSSAPRILETIPKRGYRLIATVEPIDAPVASEVQPIQRSARALIDRVQQYARLATVAAIALLLCGIAISFAIGTSLFDASRDRTGVSADAAAREIRSIAVLPIKDLSSDRSQEHFALGVTQALADTFAQAGSLRVASTVSTTRYANATPPAANIAQELRVDGLIEGAVLRSGDRVRVSIALVDGKSGQRLWTRTYDRSVADILALYTEIARSALSEVRIAADALEQSWRQRGRPVDVRAYDAYLRAMSALGNRWMAGGCRDAELLLLQAIEQDPAFAPAHAALAWCYAYPDRLGRSYADVGPKAKAAVARALQLDDGLALAHAVAATIYWRIEYDPISAERELRRATALDPNSPLVLIPAAEFLMWRGDPARGIPLVNRAVQTDPESPDVWVRAGFDFLSIGRIDSAIDHFRHALELDSRYATARFWLAEAYAYQERRDAAVAEYLQWLEQAGKLEIQERTRAELAQTYARGGWTAFWRMELRLTEREAAQPGSLLTEPYGRYAGPYYMARRCARLSEWDRALQYLEVAHQDRHHLMASLGRDSLFGPLRASPQFRELLRRTAGP